jgi:hypothetical protein
LTGVLTGERWRTSHQQDEYGNEESQRGRPNVLTSAVL